MIQLDSEQKRVLKAVVGSGMGMVAGTLIYYACSGKLESSISLLISNGHGSRFT